MFSGHRAEQEVALGETLVALRAKGDGFHLHTKADDESIHRVLPGLLCRHRLGGLTYRILTPDPNGKPRPVLLLVDS